MKRSYLTLFLALFVCVNGFTQTIVIDDMTGRYHVQKVFDLPELTKEEIFKKANEWIALNYRSANDVIQHTDLASGKIIAKGIFRVQGQMIRHTMVIEVRKNKFRASLTDFDLINLTNNTEKGLENIKFMRKEYLKEVEENCINQLGDIQLYIALSKIEEEDW